MNKILKAILILAAAGILVLISSRIKSVLLLGGTAISLFLYLYIIYKKRKSQSAKPELDEKKIEPIKGSETWKVIKNEKEQ